MKPVILMNLQLFAGEKTEKATPRKKQEARKKGQVLKSQEVNSAILLFIVFLGLKIFFPYIFDGLRKIFITTYQGYITYNLEYNTLTSYLQTVIFEFIKLSLPLLILAMVAGLASNWMQVGFLFTTESLKMKLNRINPIEGFKRIFSKKAIVELLKSLFKIGLILYIAWVTIKGKLVQLPYFMDVSLENSVTFISDAVFTVGIRITMVLMVIAGFDYLYQRYDYEENLKMSKQEVKEEYKTIEGDPQIKAKIKEKQRQMSMQRMMQDVPKANVIITNPTHFAIAIKYTAEMGAPVVVAKGVDLVAQRIKEVAIENNVVIVENKPLAQGLYKNSEIGEAIPEAFYQAVAEVLAFVYKIKKKI